MVKEPKEPKGAERPAIISLEKGSVPRRFARLFDDIEGLDRDYFFTINSFVIKGADIPSELSWEKFVELCNRISVFPEIFRYTNKEFEEEYPRILETIKERRQSTIAKDN